MSDTSMAGLVSPTKQTTAVFDPGNVFEPLALRSMFWRPAYLETSAWLEHIPFAFWLVEAHQPRVLVELGTHYGASYFAFCQAVDRLGLDTQCFAIDSWKGDEHAGFYDEQVFEKVKGYNGAQYSGFSRLVRSSFDDAVRHFTDGSIDLLHIDGLHTLEAVRHDFDTWLPKLSKRGVLVMHDTNVREHNFGVFKLFEQLQTQYPAFEFVHGHGLGVVGVGPDQGDRLKHLFKSNESKPAKRSIHEVFSRLGLACADSLATSQQQERARKLEEEVNKQKKQLEETKQSLERTKADLGTRSKELADARARMQTQIEYHAVERGQLVERATLLQEIRTELKEEVARLQGRIDTTSAELSRRIETLVRLEEASVRYQQQTHVLSEELHSRDLRMVELRQDGQKHLAEIATLQALLGERERELVQIRHAQQAKTEEIVQMREARARLTEEHGAYEQKLNALSAEVQGQALTIGTLRGDIQQYKTAADASEARLVEQERELVEGRGLREAQARELSQLRESLASQSSKTEGLSEILAYRDRELSSSQSEVVERREEVAGLKQTVERHIAEAQALNAALVKCNEDNADRTRRCSEAQVVLQQRDEAVALLEKRFAESENTITTLLQDREKAQQLLEELQAKQKTQEVEVQRLGREQLALQSDKDTLTRKLDAAEKARADLEQCHANILAKLQADLKSKEAEMQRLARENAILQTDKENLSRKAEERFSAADKARVKLEQHHATAEEQLKAKLKAQEGEVQRLGREKLALQSDKDTLARKLDERFKEVATLTQMLDAGDKARTELEQRHTEALEELKATLKSREAEVKQLTQEQATSMKWPLRLFARRVGKPRAWKDKGKLARHAQVIRQSGLFDEAWYVNRYSDISQSKADPVKHYLQFGAAEGCDPGPAFSTEAYMRAYPDVAASAINPLMHYIEHGRQEGRMIEKAKRS